MTSSVIACAMGLAVGAWATGQLRQQATTLVCQQRNILSQLLAGYGLRLLAVGALLTAMLAWSALAALGALAGYVIGRTVVLVVSRP